LRDAARRAGLDASEADDAVQDVLLDLAQVKDARPAEVGFAPWLLRAVRFRASTLRRSGQRRRRRESVPREVTADADASTRLAAVEEVERALEALGPDDREVLRLRYLYDLDYREMAFVLGMAESSCRVRVHRASERLRARLGRGAPALLAAWRLRYSPGSRGSEGSPWD
jgi:RNA polymerase sigma factor (sigma-70 family)